MADDDDDDSFGDFTFASSNHTMDVNSSSHQWGDFNSNQNNTTDHNPKSPQPKEQEQPKWVKIKGALPLSVFGGDDDENSIGGDVVNQSSFSGNGGFGFKNNDINDNGERNVHIGINDLIANLYGPREHNNNNNGNGLEFSATNSAVSKDPLSKWDSMSSLSSNTVAAASGNHGSDDEGGWEFVDAFSDSKLGQNGKEKKELREKTVFPSGLQDGSHGPVDLFAASKNGDLAESHVTDNGFDSKSTANVPNGYKEDLKAASGSTANSLRGSVDTDDAFGEFEAAFMDGPSTKKELSDQSNYPVGSHDAFQGPVDLFSLPNGYPGGSHNENNGFDFKQSPVLQNGDASNSFFQTEWKEAKDGSHNENNEFDFKQSPVLQNGDASNSFFQTEWKEAKDGSHNENNEFDFKQSPVLQNGDASNSFFQTKWKEAKDGSHNENNEFDFKQSPVLQNGDASNSFFQTEWKEAKDDSDSQPPGGGVDDENFGKFETTFPEAESKPEGSEARSKNYKEPVPLSIFGIEEEPQTDSYMNLQHEFFKPSTPGKKIQSQSSNLSINDILSDLYSQAKPISSPYLGHNPDGEVNSPHSTGKEYISRAVDDDDNFDEDDNFDDGSWEFKDASQSRPESQNLSFEKRLSNCMNFYSSLKDELCLVARHHLHGLKEAESAATLAGEEMKVESLNKEMQEAFEELHEKDILSTEVHSDDHLEPSISLKQYIETLHEPDFQILESEYHISRRLSLAESDLRTAVDLINHSTTVLKILTLAPKDEAATYLSVWIKVISACSQELKHGTWIWKQSLEKNVHREILSEPQGKQFIIALGEIYRVVVIVGAAVKIFKLWVLLSGADLERIYALLEECHSLWSNSGLEEAIPVESLLESIRHIHDLDEHAIANEVLNQEESRCWLSLLSPGVIPEMKMVVWNGDKYFVTIANFWANLVSPDPPKLSIRVG